MCIKYKKNFTAKFINNSLKSIRTVENPIDVVENCSIIRNDITQKICIFNGRKKEIKYFCGFFFLILKFGFNKSSWDFQK